MQMLPEELAMAIDFDFPYSFNEERVPTSLIKEYIYNIFPLNHLPPLVLSISESWSPSPPILIRALESAPSYIHGYQLSVYGLPKLVKALKKFLISSYELREQDNAFETAVSTNGALVNVFCFAKYIHSLNSSKNTAIVAYPDWGYGSALEKAGFNVQYIPLNIENNFLPSIDEYITLIDSHKVGLIILNPQHNPTGVNWPEALISKIINLAISENIAILIDDAHYALVDTGVKATATLKLLLNQLPDPQTIEWLCLRSLGKQFNCNGWGLGALIANDRTLKVLLNNVLFQYADRCYQAVLQYAMACWLESDKWEGYTKLKQNKLRRNRKFITDYFINELQYSKSSLPQSNCTPFMLLPIPEKYKTKGVSKFIREVFIKTGLLFAPAFLKSPAFLPDYHNNLIRLNITVDLKVLKDVTRRIERYQIYK